MIKTINTLFVTMFGIRENSKNSWNFWIFGNSNFTIYFFSYINLVSCNIIFIGLIIIFIFSFLAVAIYIKDNNK